MSRTGQSHHGSESFLSITKFPVIFKFSINLWPIFWYTVPIMLLSPQPRMADGCVFVKNDFISDKQGHIAGGSEKSVL